MTRESNLWRHTGGAPINAAPLKADVTADIIVVGGGFTGCSSALHLAEAGAEVRLVEAEVVGHGGSGRNVGLVNAGLWTPPAEIEARLGEHAGRRLNSRLAAAPDLVFELIHRHGIDCEAVRKGTLHCAHNATGLADLKNRHRQLIARGAPVSLLDAGQTMRRTGSRRFHGALFDPRAGTIQPLAYARGLARAAIAAGAVFHEHSPATRIEHTGSMWHVRTQGGSIAAPVLVQATDSYESRAQIRPSFTPVHYFQCATPPLSASLRQNILPEGEGCWDTAMVMSSFRLDAQGRMIIGAVGHLDGSLGGTHAGWAGRKLASLFPQLAKVPFEHAWCGRIGMTSDHLPKVTLIGPQGIAIYGYSGRGIGPGTVFGAAAADWARGNGDDVFPVPIVMGPQLESFTTVKKHYYEIGSVLTHLIDARRWTG